MTATIPRPTTPADESAALFLDTHAAAALLGYSEKTLRMWRGRREGPPYLKRGFSVRYEKAALIAWMRAQQPAPERAPTAA